LTSKLPSITPLLGDEHPFTTYVSVKTRGFHDS
jgi:hypothetical protein